MAQLGFRLRIFLLQPPRVLGLQRYFTVPFSLRVLAFLKIFYSFTVCTSGWPQTQDIPAPSTAFSPRLLLCVCGGGSFAHCTQPTPGMVLAGHLLFMYMSRLRKYNREQTHRCDLWGCHLLGVSRTGSLGSSGPPRHSSFVQALYKEGGSPGVVGRPGAQLLFPVTRLCPL